MDSYFELVSKQRQYFCQGHTKDLSFRIKALTMLHQMIKTHESELLHTLHQDLNKSEFESYLSEIAILLEEIRFTLKHIKKWARQRKVRSSLAQFGSKSYIYPEPYGVVLIISPWNYPFQLAIAPLIGAIAAGNCALIKPSELTPMTSSLIAKLIEAYFPKEYISVVQGGADTSQALLKEKFDYIFFTGSVQVGKDIMEAAAKKLTPVTLELGGKSPCIVHRDAIIKHATKRIAWGKFINAGQTCVAPDYVYVHKDIKDEFIEMLGTAIKEMVGDVLSSGNFTRIVNDKPFNRLRSYLDDGNIVFGGNYNRNSLIIEPTILDNPSWDNLVMKDEIFGPILPVLEYDNKVELIESVNKRPKPLAFYIFSEDKNFIKSTLNQVSFGGGCINDVIYHLSSPYLPFGGVGESGIGAYHGKGSFDLFSHEKSILKQTTLFDLPFRYPNNKNALKILKTLIK